MKNYRNVLGYSLILIAIGVLLILPDIIYPKIYDDGIDTTNYLIKVGLNATRYILIAIFSFILGIKTLFKE
ncbi:hypothetical protein [Carnobacterium sp. TMP28]|uniref:hypothetical protein n=1 Tax=Carnobacterium sp. TMP28 TaxID=3397060 RepID=UPI0039E128CF